MINRDTKWRSGLSRIFGSGTAVHSLAPRWDSGGPPDSPLSLPSPIWANTISLNPDPYPPLAWLPFGSPLLSPLLLPKPLHPTCEFQPQSLYCDPSKTRILTLPLPLLNPSIASWCSGRKPTPHSARSSPAPSTPSLAVLSHTPTVLQPHAPMHGSASNKPGCACLWAFAYALPSAWCVLPLHNQSSFIPPFRWFSFERASQTLSLSLETQLPCSQASCTISLSASHCPPLNHPGNSLRAGTSSDSEHWGSIWSNKGQFKSLPQCWDGKPRGYRHVWVRCAGRNGSNAGSTVQVLWPWANKFPCLNLSSLIYKMGIVIVLDSMFYEDSVKYTSVPGIY